MTTTLRADQHIISQWITPNSRVLDLGCGGGSLLAYLQKEMAVEGYGLEIDIQKINLCLERNINVIQRDLNAGLSDFKDNSFDYVVMSQAIQAVERPTVLLEEMLRIGKQGIITFPNFGHWRSRVQLSFGGHMPKSKALPDEWHNTPNIHLCTLKDFESLCRNKAISVLERIVVDSNHRSTLALTMAPNLFGELALYRFQRNC